jgi:hypothetical protein
VEYWEWTSFGGVMTATTYIGGRRELGGGERFEALLEFGSADLVWLHNSLYNS